jgi:hypothetical protein
VRAHLGAEELVELADQLASHERAAVEPGAKFSARRCSFLEAIRHEDSSAAASFAPASPCSSCLTSPLQLYTDAITGDEMVSDGYKIHEVDDVIYEVDAQMIVVSEGEVDIGGNPSAEEQAEALENGASQVINVVHTFRLQGTQFDKKSYLVHLKVSGVERSEAVRQRVPRSGRQAQSNVCGGRAKRANAAALGRSSWVQGVSRPRRSVSTSVALLLPLLPGRIASASSSACLESHVYASLAAPAVADSLFSLQSYMKAIKTRLAAENPDRVPIFEAKAAAFAKKVVANFKGASAAHRREERSGRAEWLTSVFGRRLRLLHRREHEPRWVSLCYQPECSGSNVADSGVPAAWSPSATTARTVSRLTSSSGRTDSRVRFACFLARPASLLTSVCDAQRPRSKPLLRVT